MEITKGIEIIDLALWIKAKKVLIMADLHIGYEEALNKQGVLVPRFQHKELMQKLEAVIEKTKPETVIINGDLKHEFGAISTQEWRETLKVFDYISENCKKIILIKGNHDNILGPIANKRNLEILDEYNIDDIYVCHGDKIPESLMFQKAKTVIIGHEHCAISIRKGIRVEKYKCFLKGKYKGKVLIAMPSFNLVTEGTDVISEEILSPFLKQNLKDFEVFIISDKAYDFGKIKNLTKV